MNADLPEPCRLRVLSWNVHGLLGPFSRDRPQRLHRIAREVAVHAPDLVAFQEAWAGSPHALIRALPGYTAHFVSSVRRSARGGLLMMVRDGSGWNLAGATASFRRFSVAAPAWKLWQGDGIAGKGATFVRLARRDVEHGLWFVCTHVQARYRGSEYRDVRFSQLRELSQWLHELGSNAPVVLAGDLNTPPHEHELYASIAGLGIDLSREHHSQPSAFTSCPAHGEHGWIDYVLVRPLPGQQIASEVRLIRNRAPDDPFSDHHGLVADVAFAPLGQR